MFVLIPFAFLFDFLQYIYSAIVAKNHQKIWLRCFFDKIHFTDIFNDIYHDYRAAILTKISLWLLPFYMTLAIYCYYVKVRRVMRTATVLYWCHSMAHIGSPEPASMLCVCFVFLYLSFFLFVVEFTSSWDTKVNFLVFIMKQLSFYRFVPRSELFQPHLVINVTGDSVGEKFELYLIPTFLLALLAAVYRDEIIISIFISL